MKRFPVLLTCITFLTIMLTGCNLSETTSLLESGESATNMGSENQTVENNKENIKEDYGNFENLTKLMFDCPNQELLEASIKSPEHIGAGVSETESEQCIMNDIEAGIAPYFSPYVSEDYLLTFLQGYSMFGHGVFDGEGTSHVESIDIKMAEDSENRQFILQVFCESDQGNSETLEIVGTFRQDNDGKLTNINFRSGYTDYLNFFR